MKISTRLSYKTTSRALMIIGLAAGSLLFNSCKKNETETTVISGLAIVNASPTPATYNVYLNGSTTRLNSAALPFGGTTGSNYYSLATGSNTIKFTSASSVESVLTKTITTNANTAYSYYLIGNTSANLDGLLVTDDLSATSADKAFIRFINLSPDAASLDLSVTASTTSLIADKSYKSASAFIQVDPKTYSFDIKDKATGAVKTTLKDVVITAGKNYTIIARGMNNPTGLEVAFGGQVITNR